MLFNSLKRNRFPLFPALCFIFGSFHYLHSSKNSAKICRIKQPSLNRQTHIGHWVSVALNQDDQSVALCRVILACSAGASVLNQFIWISSALCVPTAFPFSYSFHFTAKLSGISQCSFSEATKMVRVFSMLLCIKRLDQEDQPHCKENFTVETANA